VFAAVKGVQEIAQQVVFHSLAFASAGVLLQGRRCGPVFLQLLQGRVQPRFYGA
jgi:hypothetical protein